MTTLPCLCCGRRVPNANPRQPLHLDCWTEHHSDPTGVWPPNHDCPLDPQDEDDEASPPRDTDPTPKRHQDVTL